MDGTFYEVTVKMKPLVINLSQLTENYTARYDETLTGTLANNVKVSIADGATVTLRDVTIEGVEGEYDDAKNISGLASLAKAMRLSYWKEITPSKVLKKSIRASMFQRARRSPSKAMAILMPAATAMEQALAEATR